MPDTKNRPAVINPENYPEFISQSSGHITRRGRDLAGYFAEDPDPDAVIYEVYESETTGRFKTALTVIKPGKAGDEFYMTKGHFHEDDRAGEMYFCLKGQGMIILQTREGQTDEVKLGPGAAAYIPPGWAHRTVNTGQVELIVLAAYPETSGHDYGSIEEKGFIRRVVELQGQVQVV